MELLIELRDQARKKRDFATADRIRNGLTRDGHYPGRHARRDDLAERIGRRLEVLTPLGLKGERVARLFCPL